MTRPTGRRLEALYVVTLTLLAAHEIDSAYWHEWALFGLPGGIALFVLLHLAVLPPFLFGLARLARDPRAGVPFALVLSAAGIAAFAIHAAFLLRGHAAFRTPVSVAVLVATLLSSAALARLALHERRARRENAAAAAPGA